MNALTERHAERAWITTSTTSVAKRWFNNVKAAMTCSTPLGTARAVMLNQLLKTCSRSRRTAA